MSNIPLPSIQATISSHLSPYFLRNPMSLTLNGNIKVRSSPSGQQFFMLQSPTGFHDLRVNLVPAPQQHPLVTDSVIPIIGRLSHAPAGPTSDDYTASCVPQPRRGATRLESNVIVSGSGWVHKVDRLRGRVLIEVDGHWIIGLVYLLASHSPKLTVVLAAISEGFKRRNGLHSPTAWPSTSPGTSAN